MSQPQYDADTTFEQFLQELPSNYIELAYEFRSFTRSRKVETPQQLLRLVFLYSGLDQTFRESAASFTLLYQPITDTAVINRLRACRPWIQALLREMLPSSSFEQLKSGSRLLVTDGSTIQGPGATSIEWRLHATLDLFRLEFVHLEITDVSETESLTRIPLLPGDLVLADRGYCRQVPILGVVAAGANILVRVFPQVRFESEDGERFDFIEALRGFAHGSQVTFPVFLSGKKSSERVKGWLHAVRLPKSIADENRRKARAQRKKKGRAEPKESTLFFSEWVMVFTTLPPEELSCEVALELYKSRWQVELAFKRLKSLLNLSDLRSKKESVMGELWLYGKLLYAMCLEKKLRKRLPMEWLGLGVEREGTMWRLYKMLHQELIPVLSGSGYWQIERWPEALKALRERPRRRKVQRLPNEVIDLFMGQQYFTNDF